MRARIAHPVGPSGNITLLLGGASLAFAVLLFAVRIYGTSAPGPRAELNANPYATTNGIIAFWEQRIRDNPGDFVAYNNLADGYLRRARETGDVSDYSRAETALAASLEELPAANNYAAAVRKASLLNMKHEFEAARQEAERAIATRPGDSYGRTVLGDAQLALGYYDEAFATYQQLVHKAPGLTSFSRMAHILELRGELDQADAAWQNALNTDSQRSPENTAWARVQYGHFLFTQGRLAEAVSQYESALEALPGYVHAIAALARKAASDKRYDEAIGVYTSVVERQPVLEYVAALGDVYGAAGREEDAQQQYQLVGAIEDLYRVNGIKADTEVVVFLADHPSGEGRLEDAMDLARKAYEGRPASISTADALSWALYKSGRYEEAAAYSREALRLGTRDPLLLFHAGMISYRTGDRVAAQKYLSQAVDANPRFSVLHADRAAAVLAELNARVRSGP